MKLFNLFGKKAIAKPADTGKKDMTAEMEMYSGMRVEVTAQDGQFLFIAKLAGLRGNTAELHLRSAAGISPEEPMLVKIRGYSDYERKAVYLQGLVLPEGENLWRASELTVDEIKNARAFFRLSVDLDASLTAFGGFSAGEIPCRLLNISVGGAGVRSKERYQEGDKLLLKSRLRESAPESVMYCQVLRVEEKEDGQFEYGCQFLGLTEDDQDKISQNIFAAQLEKRRRS
ncbi:PilZ domain-containing protein [Acutalibacter sp. 1XD8-33]|uniref:flagellar brake protein n=1 Tax=Acutalibacter sp. 1XD8-33 TaxID=2320081 RepID=UPI000EA1A66B|nr:PilZ domain-containing protein [Acutalibacter sp. 1XD8-33]RKJ40936.1 PilZ domain-containing protein [Acutalibacter sp. 1XD8-33]